MPHWLYFDSINVSVKNLQLKYSNRRFLNDDLIFAYTSRAQRHTSAQLSMFIRQKGLITQ